MLGLARGTTQTGVRLYNERLALSLIRKHGSLPKAEIARLTGLSAQTVSVIVRQLEADGLLTRKQAAARQGGPAARFPSRSIPTGPSPSASRSAAAPAISCCSISPGKCATPCTGPTGFRHPGASGLRHLGDRDADRRSQAQTARAHLPGSASPRPSSCGTGKRRSGAPHAVLEAWRGFDLPGEIARLTGWPVHFCNDATAACAAELLFGKGHEYRDYAYYYVGYFIGGGIVINGSLYQGRSGNAGALGSFPVPAAGGGPQQLIRSASFYVLEQDLRRAGRDPDLLWQEAGDWSEAGSTLEPGSTRPRPVWPRRRRALPACSNVPPW